MSHIAVRLLADRFAHATEGVNYWTAQVPRFDGHRIPDEAAIYDETRHGWVARRKIPRGDDGDETLITFPAWVLYRQQVNYPSGIPADSPTEARFIQPVITIVAQLVTHDVDTEDAACDGMYMLRAARGVIMRYDDPQLTFDADRTACGCRLMPALSVVEGSFTAFQEDFVTSPGALIITYPFLESVPLDPL